MRRGHTSPGWLGAWVGRRLCTFGGCGEGRGEALMVGWGGGGGGGVSGRGARSAGTGGGTAAEDVADRAIY